MTQKQFERGIVLFASIGSHVKEYEKKNREKVKNAFFFQK